MTEDQANIDGSPDFFFRSNPVESSRRLERECARIFANLAHGQLKPDFKTIADIRKDNGSAIRKVCRHFVALRRDFDLLVPASDRFDWSRIILSEPAS